MIGVCVFDSIYLRNPLTDWEFMSKSLCSGFSWIKMVNTYLE